MHAQDSAWPSYLAAEKERLLLFLIESNRLAGSSRTLAHVDGKGHYGALSESQRYALKKEPVSVQDLVRWQRMILEEEGRSYHQGKEPIRMDDFAKRLKALNSSTEKADVVELMSWVLCELGQDLFFKESGGRLTRLLVNFVATWNKVPVLIFPESEKDLYSQAVNHPPFSNMYLSQKLRLAVFDRSGRLLDLVKDNHLTSLYEDREGHKLLVEWHHLVKRESIWSSQIG